VKELPNGFPGKIGPHQLKRFEMGVMVYFSFTAALVGFIFLCSFIITVILFYTAVAAAAAALVIILVTIIIVKFKFHII
jgi:hypothetical protein